MIGNSRPDFPVRCSPRTRQGGLLQRSGCFRRMRRLARPVAGSGSHDTGGRGLLRSAFPCATAHTSGLGSVLVVVSVVVVAVTIVLVVIICGRHDVGDGVELVLKVLVFALKVIDLLL